MLHIPPVWLPGLVIALVLGCIATLYLWLIRRRTDESKAGLTALAGMRWRDFAKLSLLAMERRGYRQIALTSEDMREQSSSFLLGKEDKQALLVCKHGVAYRIGSVSVDEIASDMRLRSAQSSVLVTQGRTLRSGKDKARQHNIEILNGHRLWREIKPLIQADLRAQVAHGTNVRMWRWTGLAWACAILAGAGVMLAWPGSETENTAATPSRTVTATPASAPARPSPTPDAAPAQAPSEADLEKERTQVSRALAQVDGLVRGIWISRSTLAVDREVSEQQALPLICAELARHPNLVLTRVQLNPPQGSDEPVHWRQCEAMKY